MRNERRLGWWDVVLDVHRGKGFHPSLEVSGSSDILMFLQAATLSNRQSWGRTEATVSEGFGSFSPGVSDSPAHVQLHCAFSLSRLQSSLSQSGPDSYVRS